MPTSRRLIPHRRMASGRPHSNSLSERRSPIDLSGVAAQHAMHVHAPTCAGLHDRLRSSRGKVHMGAADRARAGGKTGVCAGTTRRTSAGAAY
jgi:hypothetical protein